MGGGERNLCRGGPCGRPHPVRGMCVAYVIGRWPAPLLRWPGIWQVFYIAREGDSLWDIGRRYFVPVSRIREINELTDDEIRPGEKLLIVKGAS